MHKKRTETPKSWPIARKVRTQRFIAKPSHAADKSITILVLLRDMLKLAANRKEVKFILNNKEVKVNNKIRKNEIFPLSSFDVISLEKLNKYYRIEIVNKKFKLKEISKEESSLKIVKISGKKNLLKGKFQINLSDGVNFITDLKFNVGDSVLLNTSSMKIEKILPLKIGANIEVTSGKHVGKRGKILDIEEIRRGKQFKTKLDGVEVYLPHKTFLIIE
jgi:small subunit ribosomal protein S4e